MLVKEVKQGLKQIKRDHPDCNVVERAHELSTKQLTEIVLVPQGSGFIELGEVGGVVERSLDVSKEELAERRRTHDECLGRIAGSGFGVRPCWLIWLVTSEAGCGVGGGMVNVEIVGLRTLDNLRTRGSMVRSFLL